MAVHNTKGLIVAVLLSVLSGCAMFQPDISRSAWPENIPPRSEFEALYAADQRNQAVQSEEEYLTWITRFYQGWKLYPQGWNDLVPEILAGVADPDERAELAREFYDAGRFIASEWAKDADTRKVRTRQLSIWGNAMREAVARDEIRVMVEQIAQDVDRLKAQRLTYSDITPGRYYAEDEDDVFR
ncbi:hypothetical protein OOT55_05030 [Marinimicrobium sp. C6131]|uniref:hypothetical protein n=1 Tax=Marinimicrobium sp. C6131 TaxID=3022676 RepID=UPI00223CF3EE|nr:hypothetical protein [Marinimicrobium sp. C6131]UZJ45419.1 hypothetical protein OOT55_05030 [Marinimicrobium sp. C6131]